MEFKNIFYVSNFNVIGGVETFIFELARKYSDTDIAVIYKTGDEEQLRRLKQYVRVIKFANQHFKCRKAFFNYETDIIDFIEADEYIQLIHAMFKSQGIMPRQHPKIQKYLSVSKSAGKEWEELTGIKPTYCRNPLTLTEQESTPALQLVSATRLTAEKGKQRMIRLGEILNKAGINYVWYVFTNDKDAIPNPNIVYCKPRLNIRPILASLKGHGYGVQLSDSEGDCYFTRECEALGVPLLVTPIPSFKEQGLADGKNCYFISFEMDNVDVKKIVNKIPKYDPIPQEDTWDKMLAKGESQYKKDLKRKVKVKPIMTYYDLEQDRYVSTDDIFETTKVRADDLESMGLIEILRG